MGTDKVVYFNVKKEFVENNFSSIVKSILDIPIEKTRIDGEKVNDLNNIKIGALKKEVFGMGNKYYDSFDKFMILIRSDTETWVNIIDDLNSKNFSNKSEFHQFNDDDLKMRYFNSPDYDDTIIFFTIAIAYGLKFYSGSSIKEITEMLYMDFSNENIHGEMDDILFKAFTTLGLIVYYVYNNEKMGDPDIKNYLWRQKKR